MDKCLVTVTKASHGSPAPDEHHYARQELVHRDQECVVPANDAVHNSPLRVDSREVASRLDAPIALRIPISLVRCSPFARTAQTGGNTRAARRLNSSRTSWRPGLLVPQRPDRLGARREQGLTTDGE
jgi:hypothetical protein